MPTWVKEWPKLVREMSHIDPDTIFGNLLLVVYGSAGRTVGVPTGVVWVRSVELVGECLIQGRN